MKPGDKVEFTLTDEVIRGTLMPSEDSGYTIIKLDSGYNIGVKNRHIKSKRVIEAYRETNPIKPKKKQKSGLPKVSILHTGGTIASKVDYRTGGVVSRFSPEEILNMFPELQNLASIESRLMRNMFSEDMRFAHYNIMAREIEKEIKKGSQGIIITHGTDTLHYTSAALSFMLESLPIPVILVGAQRSSDRGSSDAAVNLLNAVHFICNSDFAEVGICMHANLNDDSCFILPGLKSRKMHSSRRDAFRAINAKPIATVDYKKNSISYHSKDYLKKSNSTLKVCLMKESLKIGMLKAHPNMFSSEVLAYRNYDGLVIEGTGLGHMPVNVIDDFTKEHEKILRAIKQIAGEAVVVMAPQTIYGRLQMNVYSTGRDLLEAGIIGNLCDVTPETAFIKLAFLLSTCPKNEVPALMTSNLRGELSERIEDEDFLN